MTNKEYLVKINAQIADVLRIWDGTTEFSKWLNSEKKPLWKKGDVLIRRKHVPNYNPTICRIDDIVDSEYVVRFFTEGVESTNYRHLLTPYASYNEDKVERRSINDAWEDSFEKINF